MRQRSLLLSPEHQALTPGGVQPPLQRRCRETMPRLVGKTIGGVFQPLLGVDHIAGGKAVLAAPVLAQPHQLGRGPHRAHHLVELILAVAVPERELRQVAPRERRLLPGDRVQRDLGPRNDLLAILARDPGMVLGPLGLKPLFGHPRRSRSDLVLRLKVNALRLQRAMIYAGINIQLGQPLVDMIGPRLAPLLQERIAVPLAHLLPEALGANLAHRQHDMRVRLGLAVLAPVPMHIEVRDHAPIDKLLFDEIAGEAHALSRVHLARDRELDFARQLRVLALLAGLDFIPQASAVV